MGDEPGIVQGRGYPREEKYAIAARGCPHLCTRTAGLAKGAESIADHCPVRPKAVEQRRKRINHGIQDGALEYAILH